MRADFRSEPVRTMVVLGESNAFGMCAQDPQNEWAQVVAAQIRRHQDGYLRVLNNAIPANLISPASPAYDSYEGSYATSPSALERYQQDVIAHRPDLVILAYGLNDSRCGHQTDSFMRAYESIVSDTRKQLPNSLIVLAGPYWNPQYDLEMWSRPEYDEMRDALGAFGRAGDDLVTAYNKAIGKVAEQYGCLYVDLYSFLAGATWMIHPDTCHYTDVGQATIGMLIFTTLAANCSFLAQKSIDAYTEGGAAIPNTGGTDGLPAAISRWRQR